MEALQRTIAPCKVITPTYRRLRNLQGTFSFALLSQCTHAENRWIITADQKNQTLTLKEIDQMLSPFNIAFAVYEAMASISKPENGSKEAKGLSGRLTALNVLKRTVPNVPNLNAVVFFADDDNTYDFQVFYEIKKTQAVSMWTIGCLTRHGLGTHVVDGCGNVDSWIGNRVFPVDYAGFAVDLDLLRKHIEGVRIRNKPTRQEDSLLESLNVTFRDIVPLGENCTKMSHFDSQERFSIVRFSFSTFIMNLSFIMAHEGNYAENKQTHYGMALKRD